MLTKVADEESVSFFVVGATARDLIFEYAYNITLLRATQDIDIAIHVSSWNEFERYKNRLLETGSITETKAKQRFNHKATNLPIDIIPFGKIEDKPHYISWPPDHETELNVVGFAEAIDNTLILRIRNNPSLDIRVATVPSLILLKLFAWNDRKDNKDAFDLVYIFRNYLKVGNENRIYEDHSDLLDDEPYDSIIAGAKLLGRDLAEMLSNDVKKRLIKLLSDKNLQLLAENMCSNRYTDEEEYEKNLELVTAFKSELSED